MKNNVCLDVENTRKVNMAEERIILVPHKRMKRFLKQQTDGMITKDAIEYMQLFFEQQATIICNEVLLRHNELNGRRKQANIPQKKRIPKSEFIRFVENHYNGTVVLLHEGEQAKSVKTCFSEGVEMKQEKTTPSRQENKGGNVA
jgi:hypothetical protein